MKLPRALTTALCSAAVLAAGCGDEIDRANDRIDREQERVDRAKTVIEDPVKAAEREADKALEDAISPEDQP
jgi:hypothetical protein